MAGVPEGEEKARLCTVWCGMTLCWGGCVVSVSGKMCVLVKMALCWSHTRMEQRSSLILTPLYHRASLNLPGTVPK